MQVILGLLMTALVGIDGPTGSGVAAMRRLHGLAHRNKGRAYGRLPDPRHPGFEIQDGGEAILKLSPLPAMRVPRCGRWTRQESRSFSSFSRPIRGATCYRPPR